MALPLPSFTVNSLTFTNDLALNGALQTRHKQLQLDESTPLCRYFSVGSFGKCRDGDMCPFRHVRQDNVVCKHWLRGLCKKAELCEFLHEYNLAKMPPCQFYVTPGLGCANPECLFLHVNAEKEMKECPFYARGFCRLGPRCKNRHTRGTFCPNYMSGFCISGPLCQFSHPKWDIRYAIEASREKAEADAMEEESNRYSSEDNKRNSSAGAPPFLRGGGFPAKRSNDSYRRFDDRERDNRANSHSQSHSNARDGNGDREDYRRDREFSGERGYRDDKRMRR